MVIKINVLDKAKILQALYNAATPCKVRIMNFPETKMTEQQAEERIRNSGKYKDFDYINGRLIKIDLTKARVNLSTYDKYYGVGAAEKALKDNNIDFEVLEGIKNEIS